MAEEMKIFDMNEGRFLGLLEKLIGESEFLQNSPQQGLNPKEDLAIEHIMTVLKPFLKENGGVLEVEKVTFVEGRGNLIIKYPGTHPTKICSFVGSHMDVVPATPETWERNPFKLIREDDLLYGRGTTDCLGHVAMLTDLMATLGEKKPAIETTVLCVFIANEENSGFKGIGVDQLALEGYMDACKAGPLFWIDSADSQPCVGTAGVLQWRFKFIGKLFHSGLPHKGINSIEMAMDIISQFQKRFYEDFPRDPREDEYNFTTCSTMKPTQISCTPGSLNQLPPECTVEGDIRLSPFYDFKDVKAALLRYVEEYKANPASFESGNHGPHSKFYLTEDNRPGEVELSFVSEGENGVACSLNSPGHAALLQATSTTLGKVNPYSIGGSLPLIRELQENGFDVQIAGYGFSSRYHADNECVSLDALKKATNICSDIISILDNNSKK
jgi:acetylornithine deacetylase